MSFLQNIGTTEVIVIAIIILVLFGGKKIPEFVRGLAEAIREFKKNSK
jgi:sec-independent protein translocase protein TatA